MVHSKVTDNSCKEEGAVLHSDLAHCKTNLFYRNATTLTYIQWNMSIDMVTGRSYVSQLQVSE